MHQINTKISKKNLNRGWRHFPPPFRGELTNFSFRLIIFKSWLRPDRMCFYAHDLLKDSTLKRICSLFYFDARVKTHNLYYYFYRNLRILSPQLIYLVKWAWLRRVGLEPGTIRSSAQRPNPSTTKARYTLTWEPTIHAGDSWAYICDNWRHEFITNETNENSKWINSYFTY